MEGRGERVFEINPHIRSAAISSRVICSLIFGSSRGIYTYLYKDSNINIYNPKDYSLLSYMYIYMYIYIYIYGIIQVYIGQTGLERTLQP